MMLLPLGVTIKVAVVTLVALLVTVMLRRRSAAVRHFVLATAVFGSLGVPVLERVLPPWPVPHLSLWTTSPVGSSLGLVSTPAESAAAARPVAVRPADDTAVLTVTTVLTWVWIAGAAVSGAILLAGLLRLRNLAARSAPVSSGPWLEAVDRVSRRYGVRRQVRILRCQHPTMLATWGMVKPTILLPATALDWPEDRVDAVVRHELAHVVRGDWVVAMAATVLRAVHWFNPLLWLACRQLRHEGERACDDLVLTSGISGADYATHLLEVARQSAARDSRWSPAIAIAHHSMLEGRVRAMLNARINREPLTPVARVATIAALAAVTLSVGIASVSGEARHPVRDDIRLTPTGTSPVIAGASERRMDAIRAAAAPAPVAQSRAAGGTVEGVLYDQYGGLLPGASVRLTHIITTSTHSTVTDRGGAFVFHGLASGDYELVTELPGFIAVRNVVRAEEGQITRRHITLPIGTLQETIHVTCSSSDRVASPTAPTRSVSPGPAESQAMVQRGTEPKIPGGTFAGGIGGQIKVPRKLAHVNPVCPPDAISQSTVVGLAGRIGIDGLFSDLRDVSADAGAAYVASALDAARQWVFTPTLLNGAPIEVNVTVTVSYSRSN